MRVLLLQRVRGGGLETHLKALDYPECLCPIMLPAGTVPLLPLNKLRVALGNKRNWALICLTANQENVQAVNQAPSSRRATIKTTPSSIIYFLK